MYPYPSLLKLFPKDPLRKDCPASSLLRRLHRYLRVTTVARIRRRFAGLAIPAGRGTSLSIHYALKLRRDLEPSVVRVLLVKEVVAAGPQLGRQLLHDAGEHAVDGSLLGGVAVPDGNEVRVESNGEAYSAELVIYFVAKTHQSGNH